jgi:uncharacterized protein (DUF433 family)
MKNSAIFLGKIKFFQWRRIEGISEAVTLMVTTIVEQAISRYVTRDPNVFSGEPSVAGSKVAVRDIVVLWKSGIKPEEIPAKLYDLVTAAQVFDAISFYLDNALEIDARIAWYEARPFLNPPVTLRLSPLLDEVTEDIADFRQQADDEDQSVE